MRTAVRLTLTALYTIATVCAVVLATVSNATAQNVTITLPTTNTFNVQNVQLSTGATRTTITWSSSGSFSGTHFRISVKADTANFTAPATGRTAIPATDVSWTIVSATNGTGINGTMNSSAYTVLYNAGNGKKSGTVVVDWNLAAPGTNHRSGNHQLSLHWRLDAVP
jgi:hypothetical protein